MQCVSTSGRPGHATIQVKTWDVISLCAVGPESQHSLVKSTGDIAVLE